jgi:excisionase family DNA binding protein
MSKILTIDEASAMLHLNPQVIRDYLRRGKLPGSKIGRHWRILEDELTRFLRSSNSTAEPTEPVVRVSAYGKHPLPGRSVDDFLREKHEEIDREERRLKTRQWNGLSREEKLKRIDAVMGKYADIPFSSEDLIRERRKEVEREERQWEETRQQ